MKDITREVTIGILISVIWACSTWVYGIKDNIDNNSKIDRKSFMIIRNIIDRDYSELVSKIDMYKIENQNSNRIKNSKENEHIILYILSTYNLQKAQLEESRTILTTALNDQ